MTRRKKTRSAGSEGPAVYVEKNISQLDRAGRTRQQQKKRKGVKTGNRYNPEPTVTQLKISQQKLDPRLGSKKLINLNHNENSNKLDSDLNLKQQAHNELTQLENDPQLQSLLDQIDNGESLTSTQQELVNRQLDRIEQLMKLLNISY